MKYSEEVLKEKLAIYKALDDMDLYEKSTIITLKEFLTITIPIIEKKLRMITEEKQ